MSPIVHPDYRGNGIHRLIWTAAIAVALVAVWVAPSTWTGMAVIVVVFAYAIWTSWGFWRL